MGIRELSSQKKFWIGQFGRKIFKNYFLKICLEERKKESKNHNKKYEVKYY